MMKKIVILILLCFWSLWVSAQSLVENFYYNYGEDIPFTVVNVSAKMFSLIADMSDPETESVIKDLTGFRLLKTDRDAAKYYREALYMVEAQRSGFEELISVQEEQESVRIYIREVKGTITELVVLVNNGKEFVLMGFTGNIDLKKISQLSKTVNVSGIEYLDKIK